MVFKPINLARQSFIKTFTHGYAQSLVASAQTTSSYPTPSFQSLSSNFFGSFGKGTYQPVQYVSHSSSSSTGAGAGTGPGGKPIETDPTGHDGGLAAYYAAWHKHQRAEEKEWHQFQFAKRIGWKAPTTIPEGQSKLPAKLAEVQERPSRVLQRARSTSAIGDRRRTQSSGAVESRPLAQVEEIDAKEKESTTQHGPAASSAAEVQEVSEDVVTAATDSLASTGSPSVSTSQDYTTDATSISDVESYTEHLVQLAESQRYAEIPPVFEGLLLTGAKPSSSAYNALLLAAINLPRGKHQVVPRVLDVYADMLRRRVTPDTATYAVLIELLAARALDVTAMKKELSDKQIRYGGMEDHEIFLFRSDEVESKILVEDDSLALAIRLFDTSAAVATSHKFPAETYRLLISACAEQGRIGDMVRIYADMESQQVVPPTSIFVPMINSFARAGDLRSSVECYQEYKALAVAHDLGKQSIVRKDEEVYASVVQAYSLCGQPTGGLKFFGKIEDAMEGSDSLPVLRDTVSLRALHPHWLAQGNHVEAISHASENLTPAARGQGLSAICVDAADKNLADAANDAFAAMVDAKSGDFSIPTMAMLAMHIRNGDAVAASATWDLLKTLQPSIGFVEPITMYALSSLSGEDPINRFGEVRDMFARVRAYECSKRQNKTDVTDRIDEAIETIGRHMLNSTTMPNNLKSLSLLKMMMDNGGLVAPIAERLLAGFGPGDISLLSWADMDVLIQVQAGLLMDTVQLDIAHEARFSHMLDLIITNGINMDKTTANLVTQTLSKINRPELVARWQMQQYPIATPLQSPAQFSVPFSPVALHESMTYDDNFDPYGSSTDFKGSAIISEELEKTYGRHSAHLDEALSRFKNMRRIGRHPRYLTYAKLITAAAKENRLNLATEILEMARQDVPLMPSSRIVRHGWVSILDAMVGACLTIGKRDLAAQYHQELGDMGAAPSANTFGLYITTLKESTKTFDEATEAVKIFHRASGEGVEPSSFLYNALIGKLGKARRIDDCLFYFAEMRNKGIRPTSVTYGTIVNALCRVSDDKFAEELFEEMESMPNYKPRPAPYNSLMQYFLSTKRDRSKVLAYYERMKAKNIEPTMHTYKLLIDTHATLEPIDMAAAEAVLATIQASGAHPEAVHYASLIHAKGCVLHDAAGARATFDSVVAGGRVPPQASLYQALFESLVANHDIAATEPLVRQMKQQGVAMTPYIANTLIHGWALARDIGKAKAVFDALGRENREPSTYEAMTRAYLAVEQHGNAMKVVGEALRRGYPAAVANKICDLVGGGKNVL